MDRRSFVEAAAAGAFNPFSEPAKPTAQETPAFDVRQFGATGDGSTDDRAAIQSAIDAAQASGGTVTFPAGDYLIRATSSLDSRPDGLVVRYTSQHESGRRVTLDMSRGARLLAGDNDMVVLRLSDSYSVVSGAVVDGNGRSGVWGIAIVPESMTQVDQRVFQSFNALYGPFVQRCSEGLVLQCGPDVDGLDSGCWYNKIVDAHMYRCARGVWMRDGTNASSSGCNRNFFRGLRVGNVVNTGIQIDSGDTNVFDGVALEGVREGIEPNGTPTGIIVRAASDAGYDNNHNMFIGALFEGCTQDVDIENARTTFVGTNLSLRKSTLDAPPSLMLGSDPATTPVSLGLGRVVYQNNDLLPDVPVSALYVAGNGLHLSNALGTDATHIVQEAGYVQQAAISDPQPPAEGNARLYVRTDEEGRCQLVVRFPSGNAHILAEER